jgi:hypothetical protein
MNTAKPLAALVVAFLLSQFSALAQYEFLITVRGTSYQPNSAGNIVAVPITETTLLQDAAAAGGITDLKSLALVYHVGGSSFGDTIDVVNATNGVPYTTLFGLFFGDDISLGRTALTNSVGTEVRRVDYIYTSQNSHSMGAGFVSKRYLTDAGGNVRTTIDAQMQWIVNPQGADGTKVCTASFTTTRLFTGAP